MSKAVLVIDMPESINGETPCKHCSLHIAEYDDYYHHYVCQDITIVDGDEWEIYKKCPLKPLVDAIPIKWIKNYASHKASKDLIDCYWHFWEDDVLKMVSDWKKENEKRYEI